MKKYIAFFCLFLAYLTVNFSTLTSAWSKNILVEHVSGKTEVIAKPRKVVVFDLASLDNVTRLGVETVIGVPKIGLPAYLKQYDDKDYSKVGTLFEPNYEIIANLAPDLVIVAGRSQPKYKELSRIAPTIDLTVGNNHYLEDIKRNVTILGKIFCKEQEAEEEIAMLIQSIADLKQLVANKGNALLILTTGGKINAYGPGSRFGFLHSEFGIVPAYSNLSVGKHGQPISPEFILETDPDWLFVIDRDTAIGATGKAARQLLDNPIINQIKAARQDRIVYLDPNNWYLVGGGLSSLHETINNIKRTYQQKR